MKEAVKVNSFGEKDKELAIDEESIQFQGKAIRRNEITGIQYWISAIQFYEFSVGVKYYIGLKTPADQLDITLKCYFGIGNSYFKKLCNQVIDIVWDPVIDQIWNANIDLILSGGAMEVGNCQINKEGIQISKGHLIAKQQHLIRWEDLDYEKKYDRLVINSKKDHGIYTNLYYRNSWNIDVLMALLDWVTKEGGLAELQKERA